MWKIQLIIAISFMSSKDNEEECEMHLEIGNMEIMINDKPKEITEEIFQSLLSRYQISDLIYDCVHLLYYKCHKINFK